MGEQIKKQNKRRVESWTTNDFVARIESGELDLETEYQRDIIWKKEKQQLLVDSILKDIDVPKIYLAYFKDDKKYECVDGKQRIASILDFYNNAIPTPSNEYFKSLSNKKDFLEYSFSVSIIEDPTDDDITELFKRLNIGTPLNGGEQIHAMRGDMRDFIFKEIGRNGPFIGKVRMGKTDKKGYRFPREITIAQMIINSIFFRENEEKFVRARYEDLRQFLEQTKYKKFDKATREKADDFLATLKTTGDLFGESASKLNRKSTIVSAYLLCESKIKNGSEEDLKKFPRFYLQLLDTLKEQAKLIKGFKPPTNKLLLETFQKNLQQASVEGYSVGRRQKFLQSAFAYYLQEGEIVSTEEQLKN